LSSREETRRPFERKRNEEKSAKTTTRRKTFDFDVGARRIMVLFLLLIKCYLYFWGKCDKNTVAFLPEEEDTQKNKRPEKTDFSERRALENCASSVVCFF